MFQKDSLVVYGSAGVCCVSEIGAPPDSSISDGSRLYYRLSPVHGSGIIYAPVDTTVFMRPVLTMEEARSLIAEIPEIEEDDCDCRDQKRLADHYRKFLLSHECKDLLLLIKSVYRKSRRLGQTGKKLGQIDRLYMKRAEDLLYQELSTALDIPYDKVQQFIAEEVESV